MTKNYIDVITKTEKEIKKMEKALESMKKNKGISTDAISGQEQALDEKRTQLDGLRKMAEAEQSGNYKDLFLTFSIVDDDTLKVTEKKYKVAFVKNNRPIKQEKVDGFITIIAKGKYEKAMPIIAVTAKYAIEHGYEVRDAKKNTVTKENAEDYIVILDGQHRTLAFLMCCLTKSRVVPCTHIRDGIDIGQYLVDINDVGTSWNLQDRFAVAALTSNDTLAHEIADRIDEGFSPSTASLIYTGKKISGTQVKKLLRGEKWTLPEGAKTDIERGNKFILLCKEAKIEKKFVKKRFFINAFNSYALSVGEEAAFENLGKLKTQNLTDEMLIAIKDDQGFIKLLASA